MVTIEEVEKFLARMKEKVKVFGIIAEYKMKFPFKN